MRIWQIQAYVKKKSLTKLAPLLKDGITDSNTGLCKKKKRVCKNLLLKIVDFYILLPGLINN
jgi:hypothetical protein